VRYVLERGLCEVRTGDGAWTVTYTRLGFVRYVRETRLGELHTGDRAL
jgi:hypothetical protein